MPPETSSSTLAAPIPAAAMPLVSPNALLHAHLKRDRPLRPSNRSPSQARPIEVNIGSLTHCNGSSLVKVGATTIVCGVRAEILPLSEIPSFRVTKTSSYTPTPATSGIRYPDEADDDKYLAIPLYHLLVPNIELATGCSPRHPANTAPGSEAQSLSQRLLSLLHTSKIVRPSDLEIRYQPPPAAEAVELGLDRDAQLKAYWVLYIDMMCISYDGGVFDAAWMALYAALRDTMLPKVWWDADSEQVLCSPEVSEARRLRIRGAPVSTSFGVFVPEKRVKKDGEAQHWILVDTDTFEQECCGETGCITIDVDDAGSVDVLRIEKSRGSVFGVEEAERMTAIATSRWKEWKRVLDDALKASR